MKPLNRCFLYAILDTGYTSNEAWTATAEALIAGGADILQVRAKGSSDTEIEARARAVLPLCQSKGVPLIINDAVHVALRLPGVGAHIGQDDMSPEDARERLGPERILGLSTHSQQQIEGALARAHLLDYFAVGPIFATPTKPTYEPVGLALASYARSKDGPIPFFCIGGIKRHNLQRVLDAGGQRVVVVSDLLCDPDPASAVRVYRKALTGSHSDKGLDRC